MEKPQSPPNLSPPLVDKILISIITKNDIPEGELYDLGFTAEQIEAQKKEKEEKRLKRKAKK